MKKKYFTLINFILSSLITLLGLGSCKSAKPVKEDTPLPADEFIRQQDLIEKERQEREIRTLDSLKKAAREQKELKVVYGPPPMNY